MDGSPFSESHRMEVQDSILERHQRCSKMQEILPPVFCARGGKVVPRKMRGSEERRGWCHLCSRTPQDSCGKSMLMCII